MRIPISWLKDYVDVTVTPQELADMLTIAGMEVDAVEYIGIPGGNDEDQRLVWDRYLLIIGQITKVEQHPNADKLVLATVEYGAAEPEVVVTGAPNIFEFIGVGDITDKNLFTPFALEGAIVYDGHKEGNVKMKLKGKALRGIHNRCMVCSAKELGLGEEHDGILLTNAADLGVDALIPGTPLQDIFGDVIIDFEVIPNIARTASIVGVAREVAALTGRKVRYPSYKVQQDGATNVNDVAIITTENPDLNPRFSAMLIENVGLHPSPLWMQRRLEMAGMRPKNVVVDISNYVMLEMGQPNHTFDWDYMKSRAADYGGETGGKVHINTRLAHDGEKLVTLDGSERELKPFSILVTDPAGNLSLGGIMGGQNSEISDSTTNVLLEAAAWNFMNIRRTSHSLKLASDAGFRFSRGVHPSQAILGCKRAADLLRVYAGGTVAQGIIDYYPQPAETVTVETDVSYVRRWSGLVDITAAECKSLLEKLEFVVELDGDTIVATAPDHRIDIVGKHDIVEEICRMYGYDNLPATEMADVLPPQRNNVSLDREMRLKDTLVNLGMQEVITYRLTTPEREAKLLATGPADDRSYVTLANYVSADRVAMRHSLLASVAEIAADNSRHAGRISIFEVGKVYLPNEEGDLPTENTRVAMIMNGERGKQSWQDGSAPAEYDFYDIKGVVEDLINSLNVQNFRLKAGEHPTFRPGRTAKLMLNDKIMGWMGELHPLVVDGLEFRTDSAVLAADIDLDILLKKVKDGVKFDPPSPYPAVQEDLAVIVDSGTSTADVAEAIKRAGGFLLKRVELFDVYEGESIPDGKRSLAFHLAFQSPSKTLKDKDVAKLRKKIIGGLKHKLNATIRE